MPVVHVTLHRPDDTSHAGHALAPDEGAITIGIPRAEEEYVAEAAKNRDKRAGKYRNLVQALIAPVADLNLSARPASALQTLNIRYGYELVQKSPVDLFQLPNFGNTSLKEFKEKLATLGLTLGMTLDDDSYRAAIIATADHHRGGLGGGDGLTGSRV